MIQNNDRNPEPAEAKRAAAEYSRAALPTDPDMGWRREDVEIAFRVGAEWRANQYE